MTTNNVAAAAATLEDAHNHDDMLENMSIPLCFEILHQNRTNGIYLDLSEHCFTSEEKMYGAYKYYFILSVYKFRCLGRRIRAIVFYMLTPKPCVAVICRTCYIAYKS